MHSADFTLSLQIQKLIVKHITTLQVLIGPIARRRDVQQTSRVEFPSAEQSPRILQRFEHAMEERIVASRLPVSTTSDDEPQIGIHAARRSAVTDPFGNRIDVARDFPVRPLVTYE